MKFFCLRFLKLTPTITMSQHKLLSASVYVNIFWWFRSYFLSDKAYSIVSRLNNLSKYCLCVISISSVKSVFIWNDKILATMRDYKLYYKKIWLECRYVIKPILLFIEPFSIISPDNSGNKCLQLIKWEIMRGQPYYWSEINLLSI